LIGWAPYDAKQWQAFCADSEWRRHVQSQFTPMLTVRRADGDSFAPASELVRVRDDGEFPQLDLHMPQYGHFDVTAITRYDDVRELLSSPDVIMGPHSEATTPDTLASIPGYFIYYDGEAHARIRRMISGWFSVKRIQRLRPLIVRVVDDALDAMAALGNRADLFADFARGIPTKIICEVLGIPFEDSADFQAWTEAVLSSSATSVDSRAGVVAMRNYLRDRVAAAKRAPREDLISTLLVENEGEITDEEVVGISMFVLIAGHETTANAITTATLALLENPEQLAEVRDDDSVIRGAVEELLRYLSLPVGVHRLVTRDTVIAGYEFHADERISFSLLAANNDPALVGNTPQLDIHRRPVPHVTFGYGVHQCLGQHLARLELTVALPRLLRRFPRLRLDVAPSDIAFRLDGPIYGVSSLPVTW